MIDRTTADQSGGVGTPTVSNDCCGSLLRLLSVDLSSKPVGVWAKTKKSENDRYLVHTSFAHRLVGTVILALSEYGEIPRYKNKIIKRTSEDYTSRYALAEAAY